MKILARVLTVCGVTVIATMSACQSSTPTTKKSADTAKPGGTNGATVPSGSSNQVAAKPSNAGTGSGCATGSNGYANGSSGTGTSSSPGNASGQWSGTGNGAFTNSSYGLTGLGFGLADAAPTYNDTIKGFLDTNCVGCHQPGKDSPDLSTYEAAKAAAGASSSDIASGSMPERATLGAADKDTFKRWVDAGEPQSLADVGGNTGTIGTGGNTGIGTGGNTGTIGTGGYDGTVGTGGNTGTIGNSNSPTSVSWGGSGSSPCTNAGSGSSSNSNANFGAGAPSGDPFGDLIDPKALEDCKAQNKLYDRAKGECHIANIAASYDCSDQGIIAAFQKAGVGVQSQLQSFLDGGYQIDQCGELNNEPIIYFYKKVDGGDTVKLQVKKLCKINSPACG